MEHGTGPEIRHGLVCHAEKAVRREIIGLKPAGVLCGRTESLPSSLSVNCQSQENTSRAIRADLGTSEGNSVRVLLTADVGTIAVLKLERLPEILRRGTRLGVVQRVPDAS